MTKLFVVAALAATIAAAWVLRWAREGVDRASAEIHELTKAWG